MKLVNYSLTNYPPLKRFSVENLSDVVVFAGPNGVGKTKLLNVLLVAFQNLDNIPNVQVTVKATCTEERESWGGRETLNTVIPAEAQLLRSMLQRNYKRAYLRSGVLNFDSARSFQEIQPLQPAWYWSDPFEDQVGWNESFAPLRNRFQGVVHALLRKMRAYKDDIARQAMVLIKEGKPRMDLDFPDPLTRFKESFARLLPGKTLVEINEQQQTIQYMQDGQVLNLDQLSSGEREVVTVVFDFLLRNPRDCIVVFDEPELHLHPELSYRLLRTLQEAGEHNQFIFCTHSPDIISASLEQTVVFVAPARGPTDNQALPVKEDDQMAEILRALGQSIGVISLGKKIVLIEGDKGSLDKETYGSILGQNQSGLVLVPVGGKDAIEAFDRALEGVLSRAVWGVDFFMLCDGDASVSAKAGGGGTSGRLRRLSRYHLENFFLEEHTWNRVFEHLEVPAGDPLRDPTTIRRMLRDIAKGFVSYTVMLRVAHQLRMRAGNVDLMANGVSGSDLQVLTELVEKKRSAELARVTTALESVAAKSLIEAEHKHIMESLESDTDLWKTLVPGRPVLKKFARDAHQDYSTLKRLYIKVAPTVSPDPFAEIRQIFAEFLSS